MLLISSSSTTQALPFLWEEAFFKELQVCPFGLKEQGRLFILVLQFVPQKELASFMRHHIRALGILLLIKSLLCQVFLNHQQYFA